jgi:hypothetical protein
MNQVAAVETQAGTGLSRTLCLVVLGLCVLALLPVVLVANPPLQDYPSHLARIHILASIDDPATDKFYWAAWALRPNLGFEAIMLGLSHFMTIETAGRVFLALTMCVLGTAPVVLHYALWRTLSPTALFGFPLIFNLALQKGFLSFLLGAGLAIHAFALWIWLRNAPWHVRMIALGLVSFTLLLCHLHAFGVFALIVLSSEAYMVPPPAAAADRIRRVVAAGLPMAIPFAFLWAVSPTTEAGLGISVRPPQDLIWHVLTPMTIDEHPLSIAVWCLTFVPLVLVWLSGEAILHPRARAPLALLLACSILLPFTIFGSNNANWRVFVPFSMLLVAAVSPQPFSARAHSALQALAIAMTVVVTLWCYAAWRPGDELAAEADRVIDQVPAGSRLFPLITEGRYLDSVDPPSYMRIAERAIPRGIFVPSILADPRHQPLRFDPQVEPLRRPLGRIYYGKERNWPLDWELVRREMDYVFLIHTQPDSFNTAPDLPIAAEVVASEARFVLYRITKPAAP